MFESRLLLPVKYINSASSLVSGQKYVCRVCLDPIFVVVMVPSCVYSPFALCVGELKSLTPISEEEQSG